MEKKNHIKEIRELRGLTMDALADKVNTTQSQISHLETGRRKLTWDWMVRLSDALSCEPVEIAQGLQKKSADEERLIANYRELAEGEKKMLLNMLHTFADDGRKPPHDSDGNGDNHDGNETDGKRA